MLRALRSFLCAVLVFANLGGVSVVHAQLPAPAAKDPVLLVVYIHRLPGRFADVLDFALSERLQQTGAAVVHLSRSEMGACKDKDHECLARAASQPIHLLVEERREQLLPVGRPLRPDGP